MNATFRRVLIGIACGAVLAVSASEVGIGQAFATSSSEPVATNDMSAATLGGLGQHGSANIPAVSVSWASVFSASWR